MGAGHSHGPTAATVGHAGARHRWRLGVAFTMIAGFFLVELVYGLIAQSLALLSDAGHMAADVVALGAALSATWIATRKDASGRRTFGSYRAEIFASGLAVLLMLGAAGFVAIAAVRRIGGEPVAVETGPMLVVGALGLLVNLIAMAMLRGGAGESLNVKGAYFEVVADTVGSIGVICAGALVLWTGQDYWDTVVAVAIGTFIAVRAIILGREVLSVLGQHAPAGIVPAEVEASLTALPDVREVHDLHVWTLTSGMHVATAHLGTYRHTGEVLPAAQSMLRKHYGIEHATLQIEADPEACDDPQW